MRKYLLVAMLFLMALPGHADRYWYRATSYSETILKDGHFYWMPVRAVNVDICIDLTDDVVTIYGPARQVFPIIDFCNDGSPYRDGEGGVEFKLYVEDGEGRTCMVRLRYPERGSRQVYVDYLEKICVYNVEYIETVK